jgi:nucleotide-binding universal stress UspA family protein
VAAPGVDGKEGVDGPSRCEGSILTKTMGPPDELALIAYDGSSPAQYAVAQAARLLSAHRVIVVTVWEEGLAFVPAPMGLSAGGDVPIAPEVVAEIENAAQQHAERVAQYGARLAQTLGLDAEPLAVPDLGGVGETILDVARGRNPAVIVIGTRGLTGLRARLEGSTASYLLKHSNCPLLVVHPEQDKPT